MMPIIPVIDLLNGLVVHAKKGERQHYQAIQSQLTHSAEPLDIVAALLALYPFKQLYIADLNAIQKTTGRFNNNYSAITAITQQFPHLTIWLDAGIGNPIELSLWQKLNLRLVLASENFTEISHYSALAASQQDFILSLDFFAQGYQGPAELLVNAEHWPQDVIVMSLAKVGTDLGVDQALLSHIVHRANHSLIYAAGGVRNAADLMLLKELGVSGSLIASALHQQQISSIEIQAHCT